MVILLRSLGWRGHLQLCDVPGILKKQILHPVCDLNFTAGPSAFLMGLSAVCHGDGVRLLDLHPACICAWQSVEAGGEGCMKAAAAAGDTVARELRETQRTTEDASLAD